MDSAPALAAETALVERDALDNVMRRLPHGLFGAFLAPVLMTAWAWSIGSQTARLVWTASIWAVESALTLFVVGYWRNPERFSTRGWLRVLATTHFLIGTAWGLANLLNGRGPDSERSLLLVLVFVCANAAAGVVAFSGFRGLTALFLLPMIGGAAVSEFATGEYVLGAGTIVFCALMIAYSKQTTDFLREALGLRYRTAALAEQLHASESLARAVLDGAGEAIWTTDLTGGVRSANPAAAEMMGRSGGDAIGHNLFEMIRGLDGAALAGEAVSFETTFVASGRDVRPVMVSASVVDHPDGALLTVLARDFAERKALEDQLAFDASHDTLTGLTNRAGFFHRAAQVLASAAPGAEVALVFVDLDRFKQVNDGLGHATGDALLCEVGVRLADHTREDDLVARLGGDEFVLLLTRPPDREALVELGDRLIASLERPFSLDGVEARVSASIGIARVKAAGTTPHELLANADVAMYRAKQNGRRQVTFFDDELQREVAEHLGIEQAFRRALHRRDLMTWGQPIVALDDRRVVGVELLARWSRPGHGHVSPAVFVSIAEEAGLTIELGRWVLARAADALEDWADHPVLRRAYASVNISGRHLIGGDLVADVERIVLARGIDPSLLVVELTETALAHDLDGACAALRAVRALGVGVAIDDFGTGYSSLQYLQALPATTLKVDRSFISRVDVDRGQETIVGTVVQLAAAFKMRVVAEGIETPGQASAVARLGAEFGQGYFFARPAALGELADWATSTAAPPLVAPGA